MSRPEGYAPTSLSVTAGDDPRRQKIEESPSPVLPDAMSVKLCESSARLAEMAGYVGVATAEYLFDPTTGACCFLEVNSRLQVEHTVTECVFGSDLVQAQIDQRCAQTI